MLLVLEFLWKVKPQINRVLKIYKEHNFWKSTLLVVSKILITVEAIRPLFYRFSDIKLSELSQINLITTSTKFSIAISFFFLFCYFSDEVFESTVKKGSLSIFTSKNTLTKAGHTKR